jgi:amino acid permease
MGFATGAICIRSADGSYTNGGPFLNDIPSNLQPAFGDLGPDIQGIVLACTLATAFVAHYNAPRFHTELQDNTERRFNLVTLISYAIAAVLSMVVAVGGFSTFGSHLSGLILNNYSPYDGLLTAVTLAACLIQDLALVLSVGGGTLSTIVASVFPALMFHATVESSNDARRELHTNLALGLMLSYVAIGATGIVLAVEKAIMH